MSRSLFFQWFGAPEARKVASLKRRVRSHVVRWEMKNCTALLREAHVQVKMFKTPQLWITFRSWDEEKVHAVVAQSTCPSQSCKKLRGSDHFWKFRCRKRARRCGAKHISKSKCTKHFSFGSLLEVEMKKKCAQLWREAHVQVKRVKKIERFGPLLEVQMSKMCTPLWREAHFQVKSVKNSELRTTFEVQMSKKCALLWREAHFQVKMHKGRPRSAHFWKLRSWKNKKVDAVVARSTSPSQNVQNTTCTDDWDVVLRGRRKGLWTLPKVSKREGFVAVSTTTAHTLHHTTLHYPTLHPTTLHPTTLPPPHYTPLRYITLHSTALRYTTPTTTTTTTTTLLHTTLHQTTVHGTTLHYITPGPNLIANALH